MARAGLVGVLALLLRGTNLLPEQGGTEGGTPPSELDPGTSGKMGPDGNAAAGHNAAGTPSASMGVNTQRQELGTLAPRPAAADSGSSAMLWRRREGTTPEEADQGLTVENHSEAGHDSEHVLWRRSPAEDEDQQSMAELRPKARSNSRSRALWDNVEFAAQPHRHKMQKKISK